MPIKIFSMLRYEVTPKVNVLGTIIVLVTITLPLVAEKLIARKINVKLSREKKNK
jgi:ABC-type spermidine/putrescine transport system permease subunit II